MIFFFCLLFDLICDKESLHFILEKNLVLKKLQKRRLIKEFELVLGQTFLSFNYPRSK